MFCGAFGALSYIEILPLKYSHADMNLSLDISLSVIIMIAAAAVLYALLWPVYLWRIRRVTHAINVANAEESSDADTYEVFLPAVSVVIYSSGGENSLRRVLQQVIGQDYASPFEVIVVTDGQSPECSAVVGEFRRIYPNVYMTYTPDDARNVSRKKLALTLGMKAARYDVVVHTTAAVSIDSDWWLYEMARPFGSGATVAIGYAYVPSDVDDKAGHRRRMFNTKADAVTWLSSAIAGKPYRGTEYNLAYSRQAFFDNKGFSHPLNLHTGDDDLLIYELASQNPEKVAVVLAHDSMPSIVSVDPCRFYRRQRRCHQFTGARLPKCSRRLMATGAWMRIASLALAVAAVVLSDLNVYVGAAALALMIAQWLSVAIVWRRAIKALHGCAMLWTLPRLSLTRLMANAVVAIHTMRHHSEYYTWRH